MQEKIIKTETPSSAIVLAVIACMMGFSGGTSYFVDVISYNKIDPCTVVFMATYVIMFAFTVVMTVGFCLHSKGKQNLIGIGAFALAFAHFAQNLSHVIVYGEVYGSVLDMGLSCVQIAALIIIGIYYVTKNPSLAYPLKLVVTVAALVSAAFVFGEFLVEPVGVGDYVAPWCMHPLFIYTAFMLYNPFKK